MAAQNCIKCYKTKALTDFYKNKSHKNGFSNCCKKCDGIRCKKYRATHKTKCTKNRKSWRKTKPGKKAKRRWQFKRKYNLTVDEHQLMYILQNGRCKICKQPTPYDKIKVDHCHKTSKIRGLLCGTCNSGLGFFRDNPQILANAIECLRESK